MLLEDSNVCWKDFLWCLFLAVHPFPSTLCPQNQSHYRQQLLQRDTDTTAALQQELQAVDVLWLGTRQTQKCQADGTRPAFHLYLSDPQIQPHPQWSASGGRCSPASHRCVAANEPHSHSDWLLLSQMWCWRGCSSAWTSQCQSHLGTTNH